MMTLLLIWLGIFAGLLVLAIGPPGRGGVLTLTYFLGLSILHVPGALAFIDPYSDVPGRDETELGFQLTLLGMAAFAVAAAISFWTAKRSVDFSAQPEKAALGENLSGRIFIAGLISYFVILPIANHLPSLTALVSPLAMLLMVGLWLRLYHASRTGNRVQIWQTITLLPVLPIATLVTGGFLGFGISMALSVIAFYFVIVRKRTWFYLITPIVVVFGLSLFATYMVVRTEIRSVVWRENSGLVDRFSSVSALATDFQLMDLSSPAVVYAITARLNQNYLVGSGITRHEDGMSLEYGATVPLWALIPRVVWPGKPAVGGSGDLVSRFTGIEFAQNTSVGTGQVLEFYMNFGTWGVVIGFLALGFLLMRIDMQITRGIVEGKLRTLLPYSLVGLSLVQPSNSLLEILVDVIAALVVAQMLISFDVFGKRPAQLAANTGVVGNP